MPLPVTSAYRPGRALPEDTAEIAEVMRIFEDESEGSPQFQQQTAYETVTAARQHRAGGTSHVPRPATRGPPGQRLRLAGVSQPRAPRAGPPLRCPGRASVLVHYPATRPAPGSATVADSARTVL